MPADNTRVRGGGFSQLIRMKLITKRLDPVHFGTMVSDLWLFVTSDFMVLKRAEKNFRYDVFACVRKFYRFCMLYEVQNRPKRIFPGPKPQSRVLNGTANDASPGFLMLI